MPMFPSAFEAAQVCEERALLIHPHPEFVAQANVRCDRLYQEAKELGFEQFWDQQASEIPWFKKWERTLEWKPPFAKWYLGGQLNASYVCLDHMIAQGKGDKVAFFWEGENGETKQATYSQMLEQVSRCANVLKKLGVQKGDRVAIHMPISLETVVAMLACARIGAVHLTIFGGIGPGGMRDRILDAQAKLVITVDGGYRRGKIVPFKETVNEAIAETPCVENVLIFKRTGHPVSAMGKDVWYDAMAAQVSAECAPEPMDSEDLLFLLYTSGTTGKPKGIMHSTGGFLVGVHNTFKWVFDIKDSDVYWCTADMGWITGNSYAVYGPLSNGATQVIYEGAPEYPHRDRVWEIIEKYKVSIFFTAPTLIRIFVKWGEEWIKKHDISSIRLLGSVGEPMNPEVWNWYRDHVGGGKAPIVDTWFQTETATFFIAPLPGLIPLKPGSVTRALPGYEIDILDDAANPVEKGLLAITKPFPSMLRGIYGDPEKYQKTYWDKWDGKYYFTGDGASFDEHRYVWVYGRIDDVIKVAAHRIGSAELENTAVAHRAVAEAAAIGVPDEIKGEEIVLFVVLKQGFEESAQLEQSIKEIIVKNEGPFARPKEVLFVGELPKNRSGKILRRLLRNAYSGEPLGDITTLESKHAVEEIQKKCACLNRR